eukprot:747907-Hanusia_phi.AAC.3
MLPALLVSLLPAYQSIFTFHTKSATIKDLHTAMLLFCPTSFPLPPPPPPPPPPLRVRYQPALSSCRSLPPSSIRFQRFHKSEDAFSLIRLASQLIFSRYRSRSRSRWTAGRKPRQLRAEGHGFTLACFAAAAFFAELRLTEG